MRLPIDQVPDEREEATEAPRPSVWAVLAAGLGIVSGLVLLVAAFVDAPVEVVLAAGAVMVLGALLATVVAVQDARRRGLGVWPTLWRVFSAPVRFLLDFAP